MSRALLGSFLEWNVGPEAEGRCRRIDEPGEVLALAGPGRDRPLVEGQIRIGNHELFVDLEVRAEPVTPLACPIG